MEDVKWLLENLPIEIVRHIIASYNPSCFFIMDSQWLLNYDWTQQCRLTFGFPHKSSIYTYYKLCQNQKHVRLACGDHYTVIGHDDGILSIGDKKQFEKISGVDYIACGDFHTIVMTADRKIYGRGRNTYMQLSDDGRKRIPEFVKINAPDDVIQIGAGYDYTAILRSNGVVMISGRDFDRYVVDYKFREMELPKDIVQIACGSINMFVLRSDGRMMACGMNESGELGIGHCRYQHKFTEINIPRDVIQIACGTNHTLVLRADGTVMGCGNNSYGQLGTAENIYQTSFAEIEYLPKDVVLIACGNSYSLVLRENGQLMSCGYNNDGQLGLGDNINMRKFTEVKNVDNVDQIVCGNNHTTITKTDGTIFGCGSLNGQLGKYMNKFEKITACMTKNE